MAIDEVWAAIRARWILIVACVILGVLGALAVSFVVTPTYRSTARVLVGTCGEGSIDQAYQCGLYAEKRTVSYLTVLSSDRLSKRVVEQLGLAESPGDLSSQLTVTAEPESVVIDIAATDEDPDRAVQIANAAAGEASAVIREVERSDRGGSPFTDVTVIAAASTPTRTGSGPAPNAALGLIIGFVIGIAAALISYRLDPYVSSAAAVRRVTDLPVLSTTDPSGVARARSASAARGLRAALLAKLPDRRSGVVLVTGVDTGDSAPSLASDLATAFAEGTGRVVLVHTDADEPPTTEPRDGGTTLADYLTSKDAPEPPLPCVGYIVVRRGVLPEGPDVDDVDSALEPGRVRTAVDRLRLVADYVVVDATALSSTSAESFAPAATIVVVAFDGRRTRADNLRAGLARLTELGATTAGLVEVVRAERSGRTHPFSRRT